MSETHARRRRAKRAEEGKKTYSAHGKLMGRKPKPLDAPIGPPPAKKFPKGVVQNPDGRPLVYDDDVRERILELLWTGQCKSMVAVCRMEGMPTYQAILDWRERYPEFREKLDRARMAIGEYYLDDIHQIADQVRQGVLDPSAGNVAIRATQWLATVTDPRTFANKSYVEKNETVKVTRIDRIEIDGLDDDQLDAIESALKSKLLIEYDDSKTPRED